MVVYSVHSLYKNPGIFLLAALFFATPAISAVPLDKSRYIGLDEVRPGANAWCLTVYEGTKIEKFGLEVISVVRNYEPGRNAIIVTSTDPRFVHTGPVAGCSGSPVYIDGRLAGALAFMLAPFNKDPLYGVTPIEEMLKAGEKQNTPDEHGHASLTAMPPDRKGSNMSAWNFARPIDLTAAADVFTRPTPAPQAMPNGASALPMVLSTSQLPAGAAERLNAACSQMGFVAASGISGSNTDANLAKNTNFEPGGVAVVPLIDGDLKATAIGTITDVVGDKVYAFGHAFLGMGATDMPLATGKVDTVVASLMRSFKLGEVLEVKGALTTDTATAVVGTIGKKAKTIPLTIKINRYNDTEIRTYHCRIVTNEILSPIMVMAAVSAAVQMRGSLPPEHSISYKVAFGLDSFAPLVFENVSSSDDASSMLKESIAVIGLCLNNPYKDVAITSIDIEAVIQPKNIIAHIWSLTLSDTTVKAGQTVSVSAVIEPYLAPKRTYTMNLRIPADLKPGDYELTITGAMGYEQFLRKTAPEKFRADNLPNMLAAMHNISQIRRDRLYLVFVLPASGVAIENAVLSDLPPSKAVVLQDDKRLLSARPWQNWIEQSVATDSIVGDSKTIRIKVEE